MDRAYWAAMFRSRAARPELGQTATPPGVRAVVQSKLGRAPVGLVAVPGATIWPSGCGWGAGVKPFGSAGATSFIVITPGSCGGCAIRDSVASGVTIASALRRVTTVPL